ncbi:cache domain-containing protein [Pseudomonas gingeri]|uniref:Cache domain-containing protein n=1 Tax=Pseudomonas gingeri TaxID=117681 RepID=A0A7Y7YCT1_9PSED|nr:cache domain-containing protein [Pseudomonas gingeri]NWA04165.1 cache domain-containing protein [Pseudomonas gingeri]NWA17511.1 cache domain-containing protein [Pseudomonas gingeri]NWA56472.1 cache domain-containing protein [Pseudomonas gingeri]NWA97782.1 cache domain-containing protein [Pseudomonas gingeri]NWB05377.1 cache domain-containing protein [Pseudomonas gingeri]
MQLKHKIVALGILPLVLAIAVICGLVISLNRQLGDQQAQLIEDSILASKRAELKNYVAMAQSLIAPMYDNGKGDAQAQQQVLEELRKLSFGINGYFFVYDHEGRSLMHARQSELVGQYLWDMKDPHGLPVIQALLKSAESGEGFQRYAWNKPSSGQVTDKLAYVVMLDRWGWMLGTGIYLEDVERATQQARDEVAQGIRTTMLAIAAVALVAVLIVFAGGMTLNVSEHRLADKKLQRLTQRIVSLQEEERSRVSRELHDGISQLLVSIKFKFELASHVLDRQEHAKGLGILKEATERLGEAIGEVRSLSHDLRSSLLDTLGLSAAIGQLAAEFEQRSGLRVNYNDNEFDCHLVDGAAVSLFRIVQEGLTNIERHAQARNVSITLHGSEESIRLTMVDDGVGFNVAQVERSQAGIGLRNMRERVEHFGGRFDLVSVPGRSELDVLLPMKMPGTER